MIDSRSVQGRVWSIIETTVWVSVRVVSLPCTVCGCDCYPRPLYSRRPGYRAVSRLCLSVCLSVCLKGKRLDVSTPKSVHIYSIAVAWHALTQRSKGHTVRKPSRRTVASDYSGCHVTLCCATCGRGRRGSACRYDCLCFLVPNKIFL